MVDLAKQEGFEEWLRTQPRDICIVIAVRAALRAFPVLAEEFGRRRKNQTVSRDIVLPVVRALASSLAVAKYPSKNDELSSYVAAAAYAAKIAGRKAYIASRAADAVDTNDADDTASIAADTVSHAAQDVGSNIPIYDFAAADARLINDGGSVLILAKQPLRIDRTFEWASGLWPRLETSLHNLENGWDVWTRWYDAVLEGKPTPGGEELDIFRVTLNSEGDWSKGPAHVNALIKVKEEEIAGKQWAATLPPGQSILVPPARRTAGTFISQSVSYFAKPLPLVESALTQADLVQYPASFVFDFEDGKIAAKAVTGGSEPLSDADDMRVELVQKLRLAARRFKQTQCPPRYVEDLELAAILIASSSAAELPAGKILSAYRSVESDAAAICSVEGRKEFSADAVAMIEDAWHSFEDFKAQLPNVIKIETNRLTLNLAVGDALAVNVEIEKLTIAVEKSTIVAQSAIQALAEGQTEVARLQQIIAQSSNQSEIVAARETQAAAVSQRAMVVRNFVVRPLKFVREHAVKGIGTGIEKSTQAATITGIALLAGYFSGPLGALSSLIASFVPLVKKADEVRKLSPPDDMTDT